jgi:hypothetical protein
MTGGLLAFTSDGDIQHAVAEHVEAIEVSGVGVYGAERKQTAQ